MAAPAPPAAPGAPPPASALYLREEEVRRGLELLHAAQLRLNRALEPALVAHRLGRAHQRALYFIARAPGLNVTQLLSRLGVTKQSLSRVIGDLSARGLIETRVGRDDRRQRLLRLTPAGAAIEAELFEAMRRHMAGAYARVGQDAVSGYWAMLDGLARG